MKLGLENISRLLELLGDPHRRVPAVLVAGTNGKGSVTTFISSILCRCGLRVGTFYSPHLFRVNERIRIDGDEIPSADLDGIIGRLREHHGEAPFTFFEGLTAAAAVHFERNGVDAAVFEVGLGGRLDATRLVNAAVTVITGISRDHGEHLGRTKRRILTEKLGIVRPRVPLVAHLSTRTLRDAARRACSRKGVPFVDVFEDTVAGLRSIGGDGMMVDITTPVRRYRGVRLRMIGEVQMKNAATAVRTAEVLAASCLRADTAAGREARGAWRRLRRKLRRLPSRPVKEGLSGAFLPGRFQVLPGTPRIIFDVSHNEEALAASLDTLRLLSPPERNILIFGVLSNKKLGRFPRRAAVAARSIYLVPLRNSRGADRQRLLELFAGAGGKGNNCTIAAVRGMGEAVRAAQRELGAGDTLLVFGSHHTVEEAAGFL